jgi:hypothetical protein
MNGTTRFYDKPPIPPLSQNHSRAFDTYSLHI